MGDKFFNKHAGAPDEIFKPLKGYEDYYVLSSKGYVISMRTDTILSLYTHLDGYIHINVYNMPEDRKYIALHILMAKTFLKKPNKEDIFVVDHINGIKTDNGLENLRYITYSGNSLNAFVTGNNPGPLGKMKIVCKMDLEENVLKRYKSVIDAAKSIGMDRSDGIIKCCKGNQYICGGFRWRYSKLNKKKEVIIYDGEIFKPLYSEKYGLHYSKYELSNFGKIRNVESGEYLIPTIRGGYYTIGIINDKGKRKRHLIHRLVAFIFLEKPVDKEKVNHIDEDKLNNHYKNLQWVTPRENSAHSMGKKIHQLDWKTGKILKTFDSVRDAARYVGKPDGFSNIAKCCIGKQGWAYGFKWAFVEIVIV